MRLSRIMIVSEVADAGGQAALGELRASAEKSSQTLTENNNPARIEALVIEQYEQLAAQLFRYAYALSKQRDVAQEAVQEVFLRYYVALVKGESIVNDRAWLYRATRNYVLDYRKGYAARNCISLERTADSELCDARQNPEKERLQSELLSYAVKLLSPKEYECLQLRAEGLNYREIAQILNVSAGTVGTMLMRGIMKIRRRVGKK